MNEELGNMIEWFNNLDPVVQAALISGVVGIMTTVINAAFNLLRPHSQSKREHKGSMEAKPQIIIRQTAKGGRNFFSGIRVNIRGDEKHE